VKSARLGRAPSTSSIQYYCGQRNTKSAVITPALFCRTSMFPRAMVESWHVGFSRRYRCPLHPGHLSPLLFVLHCNVLLRILTMCPGGLPTPYVERRDVVLGICGRRYPSEHSKHGDSVHRIDETTRRPDFRPKCNIKRLAALRSLTSLEISHFLQRLSFLTSLVQVTVNSFLTTHHSLYFPNQTNPRTAGLSIHLSCSPKSSPSWS